ncbi:MAG: hypothetical protein ACP59X_04690 [Solidesulfovibrio sp. DCME]|uniref:hypothetical protein n=1 Tax=Solidesulfovibrio sp. DCME TaxID=3447380 RepID=UPI003D0F3326
MKSKQQRTAEKTAKEIVVDASVGRSAGRTDHPVSKACREFLETFLENTQHIVAVSSHTKDEWLRHQSHLSARWLVAMFSRRRARMVHVTQDKGLWSAFGDSNLSPKAFSNLHKDLHLIETALQAQRRVASSDDTVRAICPKCVDIRKEIGEIAWVNPVHETEKPVEWLLAGAPREERHLLRSYTP